MLGRDGRPLLTRREVVRRLRVSYDRIRRWQEREVLRGKRGPDGVWWFDASDIDRLEAQIRTSVSARRREGELQGAAFARFREGASVADVVIELREPADVIRRWRGEYGDHVLGAAEWERLRVTLEAAGLYVASAAELVDAVAVLAAREARLSALEVAGHFAPRGRKNDAARSAHVPKAEGPGAHGKRRSSA